VLAYLRALVNPDDDLSFLRILNTPKRGIGAVAQGRLQQFAGAESTAVRRMLARAGEVEGLTAAACSACLELDRAFCRWGVAAGVPAEDGENPAKTDVPVADLVRAVIEESGMAEAFRNERTLEAEGRLENLQEFLGVAQDYDRNNPGGSLLDFLQEISLYADVDSLKDQQGQITLMTLHNAKGLEFPVVFMVGMEEGIFPHSRSIDEQNLEEERRLCYVGITRAMERLYLSFAHTRSLYGLGSYNQPSRFLTEIPAQLVRWDRRGGERGISPYRRSRDEGPPPGQGPAPSADRRSRPAVSPSPRSGFESGFAVGDKVLHAKFGEGIVLGVEADGIVRVFFTELAEQKRLLLDYAPLKRI
jgi:DNA helicase II / ATP-dependent DNA helicase PcrA